MFTSTWRLILGSREEESQGEVKEKIRMAVYTAGSLQWNREER